MYLWKILQGLVLNFGINWEINERRGRYIIIPKSNYRHTAMAKIMRDQSLVVHSKIFNSLPSDLRNSNQKLNTFKKKLDTFLEQIPDHPISPGLTPVLINPVTNKHSNSLLDWINYVKLSDRKITLNNEVAL